MKQKKFGDVGDSERTIEMRGGGSASETTEMRWFYTEMSTVSISTSFHLYHRWNDRIREDILRSVSIITIFTSHSQILVLFTMAVCLSGNAEHPTSNTICQSHSPNNNNTLFHPIIYKK